MWHFRFCGTVLTVLALLSFLESPTAVSAYPTTSEFPVDQSQATLGLDGSFQLAVMGNRAVPLDIPTEKFPQKTQSEKPAVEKPKATPRKASKPKKQKVKTTQAKKTPVKAPAAKEEEGFLSKTLKTLVGGDDDKKNPTSKSLVQTADGKNSEKQEEGILTKTLKTLVGGDDDKKSPAPQKAQPQQVAKKKPEPEKKEEGGLLTRTLKSLVGSDEKEETQKEKTTKKEVLNPINMVPTGSASAKKEKEEPKTAISETKKTLKDSFEKLIGVGAVDKPAEETKPVVTKQVKVEKPVKKAAPQPKRITARKYIEQEEAQLEKDRGGVEKGKNLLKESFKTLVNDDDKQKALAE